MKRMLPIGIQDFKKLRELNAVYVDKTEIIHRLITEGRYYFLSRPRRFGKSLLISTLNEIYEGNQELFEGLFIYDKIEWKKRPVIRIDFTKGKFKDIGLKAAIVKILLDNAAKYEIQLRDEEQLVKENLGNILGELITKLHEKTGEKVVILIDEYDKPIIDYLTELDKAEENREILRDFYGIIKPMDPYTEFVMLTGVTKFSKVSIFSELNNLEDITTSSSYSTIVGLTKEEIDKNFQDYEKDVLETLNLSKEVFDGELESWYDGYSWDNRTSLFNPFSVLNFFKTREFKNYWFATGTPTFLVNFIRDNGVDPEELEKAVVDSIFFDKFDLRDLDIKSLMFQTGYLTIKRVDEDGFYVLDYPNKEVRDSFTGHLLSGLSGKDLSSMSNITKNLLTAFRKNDMESFQDNINSLFASIPNQIFIKNREAYYHSLVFLTIKMVGVYIDAEISTNRGRLDAFIKTKNYLYIVEFKMLPVTAKEAITQIKEKGYADPHKADKRTKFMVGVSFDPGSKKFQDIEVEEFF
ncbi:MAG: AAA family ATPase [bacterium]